MRRQLFPVTTWVADILEVLSSVTRQAESDDIRSPRYGDVTMQWDLFCRTNQAFFTTPFSKGDEPPKKGYIEFTFPRSHFGYVRKRYVEPMFSPSEDPDGSRLRAEESLQTEMDMPV